jgi:hypothetical protein
MRCRPGSSPFSKALSAGSLPMTRSPGLRGFSTGATSLAVTERQGVCPDHANSAVALGRCLKLHGRYCSGYLGDIGIPLPDGPIEFAAWFEVSPDDPWHSFDARNTMPCNGRIPMARGRDATDVAIATTLGPCMLAGFQVLTDEVG